MIFRRHRKAKEVKTNAETKQRDAERPKAKAEHEEQTEAEEKVKKEVTDPEEIQGVKRVGSSWYEKDGEKIQGKENALKKWG